MHNFDKCVKALGASSGKVHQGPFGRCFAFSAVQHGRLGALVLQAHSCMEQQACICDVDARVHSRACSNCKVLSRLWVSQLYKKCTKEIRAEIAARVSSFIRSGSSLSLWF